MASAMRKTKPISKSATKMKSSVRRSAALRVKKVNVPERLFKIHGRGTVSGTIEGSTLIRASSPEEAGKIYQRLNIEWDLASFEWNRSLPDDFGNHIIEEVAIDAGECGGEASETLHFRSANTRFCFNVLNAATIRAEVHVAAPTLMAAVEKFAELDQTHFEWSILDWEAVGVEADVRWIDRMRPGSDERQEISVEWVADGSGKFAVSEFKLNSKRW